MSKKKKYVQPTYNLSRIGKIGELVIRRTFLRLCKEKFGTDENTAFKIFQKALELKAIELDHYWGDDAVMVYKILKHETIIL